MSVESVEAVEAAWANTLSRREFAVALLAARGLSNKDIAGQLSLAEATVKQHLHRIFRKLGVLSRYNLILSMRGINFKQQGERITVRS